MFEKLEQSYKWVSLTGGPEYTERLLFNDLKIYTLIMQVSRAIAWKNFVSWQPTSDLPLQNYVNAKVFSEARLVWHIILVFYFL